MATPNFNPNTRFYYPTAAAATASFVPSQEAQVGSEDGISSGLIVVALSDGTAYSHRIRADLRTWAVRFHGCTNDDRTNYLAFLATVGGASFEFRDDRGGSYVTARLGPAGRAPKFRGLGGARYDLEIDVEEVGT